MKFLKRAITILIVALLVTSCEVIQRIGGPTSYPKANIDTTRSATYK